MILQVLSLPWRKLASQQDPRSFSGPSDVELQRWTAELRRWAAEEDVWAGGKDMGNSGTEKNGSIRGYPLES